MLTPTVSRQHPAQTPARRFAKGHVSDSETWSFIMQKTMVLQDKRARFATRLLTR